MWRTSRVDQVPMLHDDEVAVSRSAELVRMRSTELVRMHSTPPDLSLRVHEEEEEDIVSDLYGATGASAGVTRVGDNDPGKHEHLLKSGPMGKCDDPFCSTCPSYFGYTNVPPHLESRPVREAIVGRANYLRSSAASWRRAYLPGILNPHTKVVQRWNKLFCISSLIAIFIDPVFFLLLSIEKENMCLVFNDGAAVAVTVIRSLTDFIHVCHICLQFRLAYVAPHSNIRFAGELEDDPKKIAMHYIKGWFLLDLFTALPLPQLMIWTLVRRMLGRDRGANYAKNVLRVVVLIQNIPRSIRFFPLLIGRSPSGFVFETAWSNFVINLLMYVLAGHIVGSCWYLFGLQRVNQCLENVCKNESGIPPATIFNISGTILTCNTSFLDCGTKFDPSRYASDPNYAVWTNNTSATARCLTIPSPFEYGIYQLGVPVVLEYHTLKKYIYSLFWGFQQISTLAGNQEPSTFPWEVIFTMSIVGLGLLLFALLIGNMQNFLQALGRRKLEMQLRRYDTEEWMKHRRLPLSLRKRVRQAGRYKWRLTGGVEEQDLIGDLQEDLQKDIQRYLCLELVKKVRLFELLEEHVLDAICERLYQKLYIDFSEIFRVKKPVERMLFIVRGSLESRGEDGSVVILKEGNFCGEELLSWFIDVAGVSTTRKIGTKKTGRHPLSSRTVKCITSVEAFCLDSAGLEYITTHYKAAFRSPKVQGVIRYLSLYWRSLAATRIQKAWKSSRERRRSTARPTVDANTTTVRSSVTRFGSMNDRPHL